MDTTTPAAGRIRVVGLDGDDTLWHNERRFAETHQRFYELLAPFADPEVTDAHLVDVERRNLRLFGYGVKGFTLSMIETAIELSGARVDAATIHEIVVMGKAILEAPVELLDGVEETVHRLAEHHRLVLVTKGDLFNQEAKVSASGLADLFWKVEIVSEKDPATYERILTTHGIPPSEFVMVGNSVRSDVLPVLEVGARAVHVPYALTWAIEMVAAEDLVDLDFPVLDRLSDLPALLAGWATPSRAAR